MNLLKELKSVLKPYKKKINLFKNEKPSDVSINSLYRLNCLPPIYILPVKEYSFSKEMFKCLVFSEDIELAVIKKDTPLVILKKERVIIAELPIWIYCEKDVLANYSIKIGNFKEKEIEDFINYAEVTPIPETPQGKYIKTVASFLAPLNTLSIFDLLDELESLNEEKENY